MDALAGQVSALRATVGALQAQIDALTTLLDAEIQAREAAPPVACPHDDAIEIGTLAYPRRRCTRCGVEFVTAADDALAAGCRE